MFFCFREAVGFRNDPTKAYRIGHAVSDDLQNWERDDEITGLDVSENDWDSEMMCYPNAFHCEGRTYLLYNGNEFGKRGFGLAALHD